MSNYLQYYTALVETIIFTFTDYNINEVSNNFITAI